MTLHRRLWNLAARRKSLAGWDALHPPKKPGGDWGLTLPSESFCRLFDDAFPKLDKRPWKSLSGTSRGTFFKDISAGDLATVREFLDRLAPCVVMDDLTDGSVALGFHQQKNPKTGALERTQLGGLVHEAKPYGVAATAQHKKAADELVQRLCSFVDSMPFLAAVDGYIGVPASDPTRRYQLPRGFARELAKHTGKANLSDVVTKSQSTAQLKKLAKADKVKALLGSIVVDAKRVAGKTLVIVDDLYQSGLTLNYVAEELRAAGAKKVFGLAVVKTLRSDDNVTRTGVSVRSGKGTR